MMWALFVVGHDAGHGSFSKYALLNEICGHLAHTPLLVPYHCWRLSHRHHHKHTGHLDRDEIFYPIRWRRVHSKKARDHYWSHWRLSGHLYGLFYVGLAWPLYLFASYEVRKRER
jgi:acyl-lipid omega-3 desaturase